MIACCDMCLYGLWTTDEGSLTKVGSQELGVFDYGLRTVRSVFHGWFIIIITRIGVTLSRDRINLSTSTVLIEIVGPLGRQ